MYDKLIVEELERVISEAVYPDRPRRFMMPLELAERILSMLRTQEPRVMTWDELIATDHVYIETNNDGQRYVVPGIVTIVRDTAVIASFRIGTRLIDCTIYRDVYGIECRCWTSRPTDEQRKAADW